MYKTANHDKNWRMHAEEESKVFGDGVRHSAGENGAADILRQATRRQLRLWRPALLLLFLLFGARFSSEPSEIRW